MVVPGLLDARHTEAPWRRHTFPRDQPYLVGGFIYDPFGQWPAQMRKHAETLRAHGYRVEIVPQYDEGEILHVWPPPPPGPWARLRRLPHRKSAPQ